jgi:hypothetical protein
MSSLKIIPRKGNRPGTKKIEFGHEQLDTFSPDGFREKIIEEITKWDAVTIGRSQVSEPSSVGFFVLDGKGPMDSFLFNNVKEFAHIHTTGFCIFLCPSIS